MRLKVFTIVLTVTFLFSSGSIWAQKKAVNPNSEEEVAELMADAESGDRGAQYDLSMVYAYKKDSANALKWLTKSAENGYGRAQYTLGNMYYTGSNMVKRNYEKAIEWLEASKETNYQGRNVDTLIASAKQKMVEEKNALAAKKKAAQEAKKREAAEALKKAKEAKEAAERAAALAAKEAKEAAEKAAALAAKEAQEAAEKAALEAKLAEERSKSIFWKIKNKASQLKDKALSFFK